MRHPGLEGAAPGHRTAFIATRRAVALLLAFGLVAGHLLFLAPGPASAAGLIVNSTGDGSDASLGDGACDTGNTVGPDPECTLRAAIQEANALAGSDSIGFNIPTFDPGYSPSPLAYTIRPGSALPVITDTVVIDGTSQPDFPGTPVIELDGTIAGGSVYGLRLSASASTIRGLLINRFNTGIHVDGGSGNLIAGNYVGTDVTGSVDLGNTVDGIRLSGNANTVGGSVAADRNVMSGNGDEGVDVDPGFTGNVIVGNYIGTDASGSVAIGNGSGGFSGGVLADGNGNRVGGEAPGEANVISGNGSDGVRIAIGSSNEVIGNLIGVAADGSTPLGNNGAGVALNAAASQNVIGGTTPAASNVIAHNGGDGLALLADAASGNSVLGNRIFANAGLGIDLRNDGVTVNDPGDLDAGPNDLLNFVIITSASELNGTVSTDFDLDAPAGWYRIEFFLNPSGADPSGYGEGETIIDYVVVTHTGSGLESFSHDFPGPAGAILTASATVCTDGVGCTAFGSTSEFSASVTVVDTEAPVITRLGGDPVTVVVGSVYVDAGATATDNYDGNLTASIVTVNPVNTAVVGSYTVTYDVTDSAGNPAVQVTRTVNVVNTTPPADIAPVARPDRATTDVNTDIVIDVLANDTDADGDTLKITSFTQPADGTARDTGGEIVYRPPADWSGTTTFSYVISDGRGGTDSATVTIVVAGENDAPTIENPGDQRSLEGDQPSLAVPALDMDGDPLEYGATGLPLGLSIDPFTGIISGTITDGASVDSPYAVTVTVLDDGTPTLGAVITFAWEIAPEPPAPNRPPSADDDRVTLDSYTATVVDVLGNDTDPDGDPLTVLSVGFSELGLAELNADNTITFYPRAGWVGSARLRYVVTDGRGNTASAFIIIDVPEEVLRVATKLAEQLGSPGLPFAAPPSDVTIREASLSVTAGMSLLAEAFWQSVGALQLPLAFLALAVLAVFALGGFTEIPILLAARRRRLWSIILLDREQRLVVRSGPDGDADVVYNYDPTAAGLLSVDRAHDGWIPVDSPDGGGWVESAFLTEFRELSEFMEDTRPAALLDRLRSSIESGEDFIDLVAPRGLIVSRPSSPVLVVPSADLAGLYGPGVAPQRLTDGQLAAGTALDSLRAALLDITGIGPQHSHSSFSLIPVQLWNLPYLSVQAPGHDPWRVHFEYVRGKPLIAGIAVDA